MAVNVPAACPFCLAETARFLRGGRSPHAGREEVAMLVYGVEKVGTLEEFARRVNLTMVGAKRKGRAWQFALCPAGARRRTACRTCHRRFFDSLFGTFEGAIVVTGGGGRGNIPATIERIEGRESYLERLRLENGAPSCDCGGNSHGRGQNVPYCSVLPEQRAPSPA
jgi:hypothetical protein